MAPFLSEEEQLTRVFKDPWPPKQGFFKALTSMAVILPLTGKDLPTLILLFGGEIPGGCWEHFLQPGLDGFLKWEEVCYLERAEKPAGWGICSQREIIDCK